MTNFFEDVFKNAPSIPNPGKPLNKLTKQEIQNRINNCQWTTNTGEVLNVKDMTDSHIYNSMKILLRKKPVSKHIQIWLEIFRVELTKRNTKSSRTYLVKIALIKGN